MHSNWQNQSCEDCRFRLALECRRFPPNHPPEDRRERSVEKHTYPIVAEYREWKDEIRNYNDACAEFDPVELRYA